MLLACVTTAVALVSSAADYFYALFGKRVSYNVLLLADCVIGVLICDLGLDAIIQLADPVLGIVYPPFITVVVLLVFHKRIKGKGLYRGAGYRRLRGGRGSGAARHGHHHVHATRLAAATFDGAGMAGLRRAGRHRRLDYWTHAQGNAELKT